MNKFVFLSCLLYFIFNLSLTSQSKIQDRKQFTEAESWILFEDFKEALPLYRDLLKKYPGNSNLKFRIGQCYLNIPGEKDKAIIYLEEAVKNINPEYRPGKFRENGSPHDALFYLGNAYMVNNHIDKALETFRLFSKDLDEKVYDTSTVKVQIESCYTAGELMRSSIYMREKNLGAPINDNFSESSPVVSDDETMIVFSRSLQFYDAIMYSIRVNGQWTTPVNMNEILKVDRDLYPASFSKDGKTLYLYSSAGYDGNIYTTQYISNTWTPPIALNGNINTKYWESHASVSHDNRKLYFTSNRKGGYGGLDIYVSERDSSGDWGKPENLGPSINTRYNENTPFLSEDDKILFFSSRGHKTMGGYDIFYSTLLDNGEWSEPVNAGYPVNSTDDDLFYMPLYDGFEGYYAKYSPDGFGGQDIYRTEFFSDIHPRKFVIKGTAKVAGDQGNIPERVLIRALRTTRPVQEILAYTNPMTGDYRLIAPHGKYEITYEAANSEKITKNYDFPLKNPSDSIFLPGTVLKQRSGLPASDQQALTQAPEKRTTSQKPRQVREKAGGIVPSRSSRIDLKKARVSEFPGYPEGIAPGAEPEIAILREKILKFSDVSGQGDIIRSSVEKTDKAGLLKTGDWLNHLYNQCLISGMSSGDLNRMLVILSSLPETGLEQYLDELAGFADENLRTVLTTFDPREYRIKSKEELIDYLIRNTGKLNVIKSDVFSSIGKLIASKNIPDTSVVERLREGKDSGCLLIWLIVVLGIILLILFGMKRRKKKKSNTQQNKPA
jgi:hypothetical protein